MRSNHPINNSTKLLYLEDQYKFSAHTHIVSVSIDDTDVSVVLDQTPMYVKRGGQPGDKGEVEGDDFSVEIDDVVYNEGGDISHVGKLTGCLPIEGDP